MCGSGGPEFFVNFGIMDKKKIFFMRCFTSVVSGVILALVCVKELPSWLYIYVVYNLLLGWDPSMMETIVYFSFGSVILLIAGYIYRVYCSLCWLLSESKGSHNNGAERALKRDLRQGILATSLEALNFK